MAFEEIANASIYVHQTSKDMTGLDFEHTKELENYSDSNITKFKTIYYKQSGGFAGSNVEIKVEARSLTDKQALEVQDILNEIRFFQLDPSSSGYEDQTNADSYNFTVIVEGSNGIKHEVQKMAPNPGSTDELQPLIEWICDHNECN